MKGRMAQNTLLLIVLLVTNYASSEITLATKIKDKCPSAEALRKCICTTKYGGIQITCEGFKSAEEVKQHLNALKGYTVSKLELSEFTAPSVPTDIFNELDIQHLTLEKIEVEDASFRRGQRHLQGLEESLTSLDIRKSFRGDRPLLNFQLDHLKNLEFLIFEDNSIPEVGNDWFAEGPEDLRVLIFERNNIEELGEQAFSALKNLQLLAIAGNHLNSISRSMLPKEAHKLSTLDLAYNKIHKLPSDLFSGMPSLEDLNLEHNLIHVLEEKTWSPVFSQLDKLKLSGNLVVCDDQLKWICQSKLPRALYGKCASPLNNKDLTLNAYCKQ